MILVQYLSAHYIVIYFCTLLFPIFYFLKLEQMAKCILLNTSAPKLNLCPSDWMYKLAQMSS